MPYLRRTIQLDSYLSKKLSLFSAPQQSHNLTIFNPNHLENSDNTTHLLQFKLQQFYGRLDLLDPDQQSWNSQALNTLDNKDFPTLLHREMKANRF